MLWLGDPGEYVGYAGNARLGYFRDDLEYQAKALEATRWALAVTDGSQ